MALKRPANDDKDGWKAYWKVQAQSWRREPEIDAERQKHLAVLRSIVPDITNGIYPFSHINLIVLMLSGFWQLTRVYAALLIGVTKANVIAKDWTCVVLIYGA